MNEMGWAVGQVMKTVNQLNLDNKTLAIFLSDHGPNIEICREGGTAGVFKGTLSFSDFWGLNLKHYF